MRERCTQYNYSVKLVFNGSPFGTKVKCQGNTQVTVTAGLTILFYY